MPAQGFAHQIESSIRKAASQSFRCARTVTNLLVHGGLRKEGGDVHGASGGAPIRHMRQLPRLKQLQTPAAFDTRAPSALLDHSMDCVEFLWVRLSAHVVVQNHGISMAEDDSHRRKPPHLSSSGVTSWSTPSGRRCACSKCSPLVASYAVSPAS